MVNPTSGSPSSAFLNIQLPEDDDKDDRKRDDLVNPEKTEETALVTNGKTAEFKPCGLDDSTDDDGIRAIRKNNIDYHDLLLGTLDINSITNEKFKLITIQKAFKSAVSRKNSVGLEKLFKNCYIKYEKHAMTGVFWGVFYWKFPFNEQHKKILDKLSKQNVDWNSRIVPWGDIRLPTFLFQYLRDFISSESNKTCIDGVASLIKEIIEQGADPTIRDDEGKTLLHYWLANQNIALSDPDFVQYLLSKGLYSDDKDKNGETCSKTLIKGINYRMLTKEDEKAKDLILVMLYSKTKYSINEINAWGGGFKSPKKRQKIG